MNAILLHCFKDKLFYIDFGVAPPDTYLWARSTAKIADRLTQMPANRQREVRCMAGDHLTYDVQTIFDRPSKFFTIVRNPVDRVISSFFFTPPWSAPKNLTLEQYLDGGIGLDHDNQQVRMLSGCPELDAPWKPEGGRISTPPVERVHLEMAKRNIEERFVVAASLEQFTALVWFLKRLYGWPLYQVPFRISNKTAYRPRLEDVPAATRKRLETLNQFDIELYEWVKERFAKKIEPLEPNFSREVHRFELLNSVVQQIAEYSPKPIYAAARNLLFRSR
jgi:hypothetical protein